jgi:GTP cyclohydrolase I
LATILAEFSPGTSIHKSGTDLVTSRMLGCFRENAITRQEFLGLTA